MEPENKRPPEDWHVTSFYRFTDIAAERLEPLRGEMLSLLTELEVLGLVLLSEEGINGTAAGHDRSIGTLQTWLKQRFPALRFKDSASSVQPFRRRSVNIRDEIVALKRPGQAPDAEHNHHLTPAEWEEMLNSDGPKLIIDTRNRYETRLGRFHDAIDPNLGSFSDWKAYLDSADLPKTVPVMLYCTGGIRCEKAILEMQARGFEQVWQLRDGILGYLNEFPNSNYEGECFVFDDRVSLGQDLRPSGNFGICPGCGLTADVSRSCGWCAQNYFVCCDCDNTRLQVCSKTCQDRLQRHGPKPSP